MSYSQPTHSTDGNRSDRSEQENRLKSHLHQKHFDGTSYLDVIRCSEQKQVLCTWVCIKTAEFCKDLQIFAIF